MNLLEKIENDMKSALKSADAVASGTLKMLKSDLMYEKAKTGKDLTDEQMLEVVSRAAKKRREAIDEFRKGNRDDLAIIEAAELAIIETYLPKQMSEAELEKYISDRLSAIGAVSPKDFGKVMGEMMKELKGKADGGLVRSILTKKVNG